MEEQEVSSKNHRLTVQQLEFLVQDELIRSELRLLLDRDKKRGFFPRFLRHPLTSIFVGFVLTAVLGSALSHFYSLQQEIYRREQKAFDERINAIEQFSRLVYRRYTIASMLESAFHRYTPLEEMRSRKATYDEIFLEWGSEFQAQMLGIRQVMSAVRFSEFESHVQFGLVPLLRGHDQCMTTAYNRLLRNSFDRQEMIDCGVRDLRKNALNCSYAITSGLFIVVNDLQDGSEHSNLPQIVRDNIETGCLEPARKFNS